MAITCLHCGRDNYQVRGHAPPCPLYDEPRTACEMLNSLGAKRPMAPAGSHVLVLGERFEGYYPIKWEEGRQGDEFDQWSIFGIRCEPLSVEECERILKAHSRDS